MADALKKRPRLTARLVESAKPEAKPYELRDSQVPGLLLRVQPTGYRAFYFESGWGGARRARIGNAKALTLNQARDIAVDLLGQAQRGVRPGDALPSSRKSPRLGTFIEETYTPHFEAHHSSSKNLDNLKRFADLFDLRLSEITVARIRRWREKRATAGASPATINRNTNALKACLAYAVELGELKQHPLARLGRLKVDQVNRVRFLSRDEEKALRGALEAREARIRDERRSANEWRSERGYEPLPYLDNLPFADHLRPAVLLSLNTGLRQGELFSLRWDHVGEAITVEATSSKTRTTRHIPLNTEARSVLNGWREQTDAKGLVFKGRRGGRVDNWRRSWGALLKAAGIENFRWHDLRHTFASRLVAKGVPLNTVRELLGHSDIKMTLRYAHLAPDHTSAAVELLNDD